MNEAVVEEVPVRDPVRRVIRLLRLLQQNPWLQLRPVLLPDPSEFEFLFFCRHGKFLERCLKKIEQVLERFQTIRSGGEQ